MTLSFAAALATLTIRAFGAASIIIFGSQSCRAVGGFHRPGGAEDLGKIHANTGEIYWGVGIVAHRRLKLGND
jgi:hypothetical protein